MKRSNYFKNKLVFLLLLTMIVLVGVNPISTKAIEGDKLQINIAYGLDGKIKGAAAIPVEVEVINENSQEIKGEIEVLVPNKSGKKDLFVQPVEISGSKTKKVYIPINPINQADDEVKIKVSLKSDGNVLIEKEVKINTSKTMHYGDLSIGVLSDDIKALEYLNGLKTDQGKEQNFYLNSAKAALISPELLLSNTKNIKMLDFILINNYDTSKLTEEMIKNLDSYVSAGGTLILGGTENTINNMNKSLVDVTYTKGNNKQVKFGKELSLTLPVGTLGGSFGENVLSDKSTVLTTRIQKGLGGIVIVPFDLGLKALSEYEGINDVLIKVFQKDIERKFGMNGGGSEQYPYELDQSLNTIKIDEEITVKDIIILFGGFGLIVSFGLYFVLKKLGKREILWIAIPVLSIALTLVIKNMGEKTSVKDIIVNGINIITVDKAGNGKQNSYISIGSKYKNDLNINEPEGIRIEELISENVMYMPIPAGGAQDGIGLRTTFNGNKTNYEYRGLSALELKKFMLTGKELKTQNIKSDLTYAGNGLKGSLINNGENDVYKSFVIFGSNIWDVGKIDKGGKIDFNGVNPTYIGDLSMYLMSMDQKYFEGVFGSGFSEEEKSQFKDYRRITSILKQAYIGLDQKQAYVITLTEEDINYGLDFNSNNITQVSDTVYVNNVPLSLIDEQGNTIYPPGYLEMAIETISDGLVAVPQEFIYGTGSCEMRYVLPDKYEATEVKIENIIKDGTNPPFKGEMFIFNFKTEKYEKVEIKVDTPTVLNSLKDYINEGQIKFKITVDSDEPSIMPSLSTKGRFKK